MRVLFTIFVTLFVSNSFAQVNQELLNEVMGILTDQYGFTGDLNYVTEGEDQVSPEKLNGSLERLKEALVKTRFKRSLGDFGASPVHSPLPSPIGRPKN